MPRSLRMAARPATFIVQDLRRRGAAVDDILAEAGLRRGDVADPEQRIAYDALIRLLEAAARVTGDASYGLRMGARHDLHEGGLLGFVLLNSPTLIDALANLQRYFRVVGEGEDFEVERAGPLVTLRFRETDPARRGLRHNSDYIAAMLVRASRDLTGKRLLPVRARFIHPRPNQRVDYDTHLGCPVDHDAEWDSLVFAADDTSRPVIGADARLLKVLEDACRRILGPMPARQDLLRDVRAMVLDRMSKGPLRLAEIAGALNVSAKTLERRLGERGTSFGQVLTAMRAGLSKELLRDTDLRLEQIAYLAGYSASAAWLRAFRRWTGTTPARFRARHR